MRASALHTSINLPKREQLYWAFKTRAFLLWDKPEPLIPAWLLPKAPGQQHASLHPTPPHPQGSLMKMCPTAPDIISYFNHIYLCVLNSSRLGWFGLSGLILEHFTFYWLCNSYTLHSSICPDTLFTLSSSSSFQISSFSPLSITLSRILYNQSQMTPHFTYVETSR